MSQFDRRELLDSASSDERLHDILKRREQETALNTHSAAPGTVVTFNPATQTATVLRGFLPITTDEFTGLDIPGAPVQISNVRVLLPIAMGGLAYDTWPILPGDHGLLIFCDRMLDNWYRKGGVPVDPIDGRSHDLADALFLPGLPPDGKTVVTDPTARVIEAPLIKLGKTAVQPAIKGTLFTAATTTYAAATTVYTTAVTAYSVAIAAAFTTWLITVPPTPISNGVFISALAAATVVVGAANVVYAAAGVAYTATIPSWLSTKVLVD